MRQQLKLKVSRKIGRAMLYKINMQHPLVKRLDNMVTQTSLKIAERSRKDEATC